MIKFACILEMCVNSNSHESEFTEFILFTSRYTLAYISELTARSEQNKLDNNRKFPSERNIIQRLSQLTLRRTKIQKKL
jgi:hypothetical protein